MRKAMRKVYMSILASMLVLVTTVVTTYAWANLSQYTSTERFEIGLENAEGKGKKYEKGSERE